jgi:hypothetical protein
MVYFNILYINYTTTYGRRANMKRTRKILALLLCIVMCLSLSPVSAFAAEEEPAEDVTDEAAVTEVTDDAQGEEAGEPADPADPADELC